MKAKPILIFVLSLLFSDIVYAQTQRGYVKTKGRMVDGKHVRGEGLKGATVSIKGRTPVLVDADDGSFSFPIPAQTFMVQNVQKNGYQLVDADFVTYPIQYSTSPLYILMETPEQQKQDELDTERKLRRTMQQKLQQREDELEALKAAHKITVEEYQQALEQLYADQENNEKLIADMAKQYAQMDYDQMDELNQRISDAILNGRLTEADSLLRSKGSVSERIANIRKIQQAEAQREEEIAQEQAELEASRAGTQKQIEDVAEDLHQYYDLCLFNHQFDSAAYYITLRADLDTTNYHYVLEAADYLTAQRQYQWAIKYFKTAIPIFLDGNRDSDTDEVYDSWLPHRNNVALAVIYENIGGLYSLTYRNVESERAYKKALFYAQRLDGKERVAHIHNNLGSFYKSTNREKESKEAYLEALEIYRQLVEMDPEEHEPELAHTLTVLGDFYQKEGSYEDSENALNEALSINRKLSQNDPDQYAKALAHTLESLGDLYQETDRSSEGEQAYLEALGIRRKLANDNPQAYGTILASTLEDIGDLYRRNKRYGESEAVYHEALEINRSLAESNPEVYESNLAITLLKLSVLYKDAERFEESEKACAEALGIYRRLASENLQVFDNNFIISLSQMAFLYKEQAQYEKAKLYFEEAIELCIRQYDNNPDLYLKKYQSALLSLMQLYPSEDHMNRYAIYEEWLPKMDALYQKDPVSWQDDYVVAYGNQSYHCIFLKEFAKAEQYARKALAIDSQKMYIYTNLAATLLFQGKYDEAETIYRQCKDELKDGFLQDFDDFQAAGIIPEERKADVERIRKMLNE